MLRLGKLDPSTEILDVMFLAVETYWQLLAAEREEEGAGKPQLHHLLTRLKGLLSADVASGDELEQFDLDTTVLGVLTEFEESRLRYNIRRGRSLFRIQVEFALASIDTELESIKAKSKPHGEVITYLPSGESSSPDRLRLEIILATGSPPQAIFDTFSGEGIKVEAVPRRRAPEHSASHDETRPTLRPAPGNIPHSAPPSQAPDAGYASRPPTAIQSSDSELQPNPGFRSA